MLDASAVLAYLQNEPGSELVETELADALISTVNWAEVIQKSIAGGIEVDGMRAEFSALGLTVSRFTPEEAEVAGRLWRETRRYGLSLGDRACLSLGVTRGTPVYTTDHVWKKLSVGVEVRVVRWPQG
ncbi:MAG: type II toxin-antitoxin system VapC family toxin [Gammaproteobacteria bacterium]